MHPATTPLRSLVTGATGLLGSHITERLLARGNPVRAMVRETSQTAFLEGLGVEIIRGDLLDPAACTAALRDIDVVYHAAAKVGDWGPWSEFQAGVIDATRNVAEAAARAGVARFVHISSTSAYGHPAEGGEPVTESAPLGQNLWMLWDFYTRSKVDAERVLWHLAETQGLRLTVIRPSWLYGERDRTTTARVVERIKHRGVPMLGPGDNPMSAVYAGEVADAAILAARHAGSAGEAYNITDQGPITQRDYFDLWAEACGVQPTRRRVAPSLVWFAATLLEAHGRLLHRSKPPVISRYATWLMSRRLSYSTAKARTRLGWSPSLSYRESIDRTVRWYLEQVPAGSTAQVLA